MKAFLLAAALGAAHLFANACWAEVRRVPQDHASIQAAIDAAQAGDVVLVAAGTYRERIRLKPQMIVRSDGNDTGGKTGLLRAQVTIIDGGGAGEKTPGVLMADGSTLDGFTITNVGVYDDALWKKHHATRGDDQPHEHIGHFGAPAIGAVGVNCTIVGNLVHHNGDTGIGLSGVKDKRSSPRVVGNYCYRNMGGGIGSMEGSTGWIENNVCFENFYAGIGHSGASPMVVGNRCYENVRAGIGVADGAAPILRGNECYRNRRAGIGNRGQGTEPIIEQNECYENGMAGIGCEEHASPIIRNNNCHHNQMAGIGAQDGAAPVIVGNRCRENVEAGIGLRDDATGVVVRNSLTKNQAAGIGVRAGANGVLCYNECAENKLVAIGLPDRASAVLHGNDLSRIGGGAPPLVAIRGGAKALLSENTFRGGGVAGLLVEGEVLAEKNRFLARGQEQGTAIWIWKGSSATVLGNQFVDYRQAVDANGAQVVAAGNEAQGFKGVAFLVKQSTQPAHLYGNRAISANQEDQAVKVEGAAGIVSDNLRKDPPAAN
jgi:hypothetical protein